MNKILVPMIIFVLLAWKTSCSNNRLKHHQSLRVYRMLLGLLSYIQVIILVPCSMKNSGSQATIHFEKATPNMCHQVKGNFFGQNYFASFNTLPRYLYIAGFHMEEAVHRKPNRERSNIWIWTLPSLVHSSALWWLLTSWKLQHQLSWSF